MISVKEESSAHILAYHDIRQSDSSFSDMFRHECSKVTLAEVDMKVGGGCKRDGVHGERARSRGRTRAPWLNPKLSVQLHSTIRP